MKLKWKWISVAMIFVLDIVLWPSILRFPAYLKQHFTSAATVWFREFNILDAAKLVLTDPGLQKLWLYTQPLMLLFIFLLFWKDMPGKKNRIMEGVGGPDATGSGEYGTTRWMTDKEMDQKTTVWKFGDTMTKGGIIVGAMLKKAYAWIIDLDLHTLIIGSTRSGKTRRWVFPTLWRLAFAGESMIFTDPKGELHEKSQKFLKRMGYNVVYLDFREPGRGNRWNPLHPVVEALKADKPSEAVQQASSMAHMFVHQTPGSKKGDQTWNNGAESVIQALSLAVAIEAPEDGQKHMTSVYKMLGELGEVQKVMAGKQIIDYVPLNDYMRKLPKDHPARDAFIAARLAPERMRGSFYSQVATLLRFFADPAIQYLTGTQDHELENVGKEKTAVFLIIPDEDSTRHPLAALYVEQTYQALVKLANRNKGRIPVRVNMILDEFGNMPPFKDFPTKLTVSGGRGVRWHLIVQDFQQLEELYQGAAETIKGNCHVWLYLLTASTKTAEEISKKLGDYTIQTDGSSVTDGGRSVSRSQSTGKTGRRLLKPEELERFPDNEAIVIRLRHQPARVPMPDLSQWPANADFEHDGGEEEERNVERVPIFIPEIEGLSQADQEVAAAAEPDENREEENFVFLDEEER
ncbi:VirD4-like conjugal transfer protein, CD1115 family [Paenibacillus validus]|uniref:VirD4-like conjugal transfer protein, CD1115 family n=1 Tax=Paenibacillus validus TaxID=44253 RepID=UPI003D2CC00D